MQEIKCPQINANDDLYIINELYFKNGDFVNNGDIIISVGSSKAVSDVETDFSGYIFYLKKSSDEVAFGEILADIFETKEEYETFLSQSNKDDKYEQDTSFEFVLTKPAQTFADENNISPEQIRSLNKKIIKTEDLKLLLNNFCCDDEEKLSLNQVIAASKVIQSHKEIPQAFQVMKMDCTKCEELIKSFSDECGIMIGYGEVLATILTELFDDFPYAFGRYVEANKIKKANNPEIGITIDAGNGLFLPVIKAEKKLSLEEVADKLFEYKMKAIDCSFLEEDLAGGNIAISLNPVPNMVCVAPIIFPNQGVMISVCSPIKELCFDDNKNIVEKSYLYICIAFDHRIINGSYAMEFLGKISQKLENIDFIIKKE